MAAGYERAVGAVNAAITERPLSVVAVFFVVTLVFAGGLAGVSTDPGTDSFTEDLPEQEALDRVNDEFEPAFEDDPGTVQLIQCGNVLSRSGLVAMLEVQHRLETHDELGVERTTSVASTVAGYLDEDADTTEAQLRAVEGATDSEIRAAGRAALEGRPGLSRSLSDDLSTEDPSASATIAVIETAEAPNSDAERTQLAQIQAVTDGVDGEFVVFGAAVLEAEFEQAMVDSLSLVIPVVSGLILLFLVVAYRDPFDLLLGLVALAMAVVWTFGFTGLAGIPFTQMLVAVPPLLLAVGIDFGIHAVNRYREERVEGYGIDEGMFRANSQLLVAFVIVTGTTAIGFGANLTSDLGEIRQFGLVTAVGIVFTLLIFGVFMPAAKVALDRYRARAGVPTFGTAPLGAEDSLLGRVLPVGLFVGRRAPVAMLVVVLVATFGAGYVATDIDTEFDDEDFLPYDEPPDYVEATGVIDGDDYQAAAVIDYLGDTFETGEEDQVTVYVEGPVDDSGALESAYRAGADPPETFVEDDGRAVTESVLDPMEAYAEEDPEFAALVAANDMDGNGVPDRNVGLVLDELFASPYGPRAADYLTEDRTAMRVIYQVEADAGQEAVAEDARAVADDYRMDATATGETLVFRAVTELLFASAVRSLAVALSATALFLVAVYWVLEGRPSLGVANLAPVVVAVVFLGATMAALDIPFNALTATILSITIGIGIDYSVHVTHRFADEFDRLGAADPALLRTLRGAGGGITGSMVTTTAGVGALVLSVTPLLGQFGLLTALSIVYSYLAVLVVLPPTLLVWERYLVDTTGRAGDPAAGGPIATNANADADADADAPEGADP